MISTTILLSAQLTSLGGFSPASEAATIATPQRFAGHQVTYGSRKIPFRGKVETRTDTFVLASITRRNDELVVTQRACHVRFKPVAGVSVSLDARSLPKDRFVLQEDAGLYQGRSRVAWAREDVDSDGKPGMTVVVDSSICSGSLYVGNDSRTKATAWLRRDGSISGRAKVRIDQTILGTEGVCLGMAAKDTTELVSGPFAYVPVDEDATCESWSVASWPADALDL